jgi:iron(III) transport system permease protein
MFSCFSLLFILFMREYVTAVFLIAPGSEVMGTTLLQLWDKGETGPVAALATLQVVITAAAVFLARKLFAVRIYG